MLSADAMAMRRNVRRNQFRCRTWCRLAWRQQCGRALAQSDLIMPLKRGACSTDRADSADYNSSGFDATSVVMERGVRWSLSRGF